ncbi:hypothetical protein GF356_00570 [candidate division GN15 bacterium]|nr:hypothetical protein [candidate division GN15 bacterium]
MKTKTTLLVLVLSLTGLKPGEAAVWDVAAADNLQQTIDRAADGDTLRLAAADYIARPQELVEPLCGNCLDPQTEVTATTGFVISGKGLVLVGSGAESTRLLTRAGYGVYIEDSENTELRHLTVTDGRRDPDGRATDAGIVVRRSRVLIEDCQISGNRHRLDTVVVGIGGVFGREGADIELRNCRIIDNGWDGVALYRGASAHVSDCLIQDGRGAGIGVTWDATCVAYRNEIAGYWKGIGAFGTSWVIARNNLVHDNLGWGMIATGQSYMDIANNIVYRNGNCGVAPWSTESFGRMVNNIIVGNGWRDQWVCPCVGVWNYGDWAKWDFSNNLVWDNVAGNYEAIWDQTGLHGNLSVDPEFLGPDDVRPAPESPTRHAGDSAIYNPDGSISHLGVYGGPQAWPVERIMQVVPERDTANTATRPSSQDD